MPEHRKNKRLVRLAVVDVALRRDRRVRQAVQREYIFRHHSPDGHVPVALLVEGAARVEEFQLDDLCANQTVSRVLDEPRRFASCTVHDARAFDDGPLELFDELDGCQ